MTDPFQYSVSDRLAAMLRVMLADPDATFSARDLAEQSGVALGTISSLVARASSFRWVDSHLEGGARRYRLDPDQLDDVRTAVSAAPPAVHPAHRRPEPRPTFGERRSGRPRALALPEPAPHSGRPRTLTELVATEPRELVERICERLGWDSPYEPEIEKTTVWR